MNLEEVKELFSKYGDAFFKSVLFGACVDSVVSDAIAEPGGGEPALRKARRMFQECFLALLKTPVSQAEQQGDDQRALRQVRPSESDEEVDCAVLEQQFHNLQDPELAEKVPGHIKEHLGHCPSCMMRFALYKKMFPEGLDDRGWWYVDQMTTQLYRHFSLMGATVDCRTAKRFLSVVVDSARLLAIDTPITVHIDYCQDCRNDVELLGELELGSQQADRLAQLYSQTPLEGSEGCGRFSESIRLIAGMQFDKVSKKALEHVRQCKRCRETLRNERAAMVYAVGRAEKAGQMCDRAEAVDLFDHCVLFAGVGTDERLSADSMELSRHAAGCRTCLEKIFRMHGVVFSAANRGESGIVSYYDFPSEPERDEFTNVSGYYSRTGMRVGVRDRSKDEAKAGGRTQKTKRLAGGRKPRRLVPAAAGAIMLIAVGLILLPHGANGRIALGEVYQAIANVQNVCISVFAPDREEPARIEWVSRTLDLWLQKIEKQAVLFELTTRMRTIRDYSTGSIETDAMTEELVEKVESVVGGYLGLVPFSDITDVPADAQWNHISHEDVESVIPGTEVYDLTWNAPEAGVTHYYKWRGFIDTATNLPRREEWYESPGIGHEYVLESVKVVTYPTELEIQALIAETFE